MFTVTDYQELVALNRALMEVRYLADNVDDATRGSSFLSILHVRVVDAIKATLSESGNAGQLSDWEKWQLLENRERELPRIMKYLATFWPGLPSEEGKRSVMISMLRPFIFTDDDLQRLISQLDEMMANGPSDIDE